MRRRRIVALPAAAALLAAGFAAAPSAVASGPVAGGASGGDPYFPAAGNTGYDVAHYDLDLRYDPASKALDATANLVATSTTALRSFNLDLRDLTVTKVTVNGRPASFGHAAGELTVTPRSPLPARRPFVVSEPEGASTWYPVNDVPYDKATYTFTVTVPEGTTAVGNGELVSERTGAGWTTWRWAAVNPMASYLSMAATGNYTLTTSRTS